MADTKVLSLPERFDFSYNKTFSQQYQAIFNAPEGIVKIVLDFSRVLYLDSSALGMMVLLQKKAKTAKINVAIRGAKSTAEDILKVANFNKLYDFE
ncbi:STAS domain-containing protein [Paraglaciecola sp.]|uniref:STAS domain-containing protein n=1 Tax=Paraglaciecola sp. TaxID=1920173 RepID=UPI003EF37314